MATINIKPRLVFLDDTHDPGKVQLIFEKVGGDGSCGTLVTYENVNQFWEDRTNEFQLLDTEDQDFGGRKWDRCLCLFPKVSQVFSPCRGMELTPFVVPGNFQITFPGDFCIPSMGQELTDYGPDHFRVTDPRGKTYLMVPLPYTEEDPSFPGLCQYETYLLLDGNYASVDFSFGVEVDGVVIQKAWYAHVKINPDHVEIAVSFNGVGTTTGPVVKYRASFNPDDAESSDTSVNPLFQPLAATWYEDVDPPDESSPDCGVSSPIILEAVA